MVQYGRRKYNYMGGENGTIWVAERVKKDVNAKRTTHFLKHAWIGNRPALKKQHFLQTQQKPMYIAYNLSVEITSNLPNKCIYM